MFIEIGGRQNVVIGALEQRINRTIGTVSTPLLPPMIPQYNADTLTVTVCYLLRVLLTQSSSPFSSKSPGKKDLIYRVPCIQRPGQIENAICVCT